ALVAVALFGCLLVILLARLRVWCKGHGYGMIMLVSGAEILIAAFLGICPWALVQFTCILLVVATVTLFTRRWISILTLVTLLAPISAVLAFLFDLAYTAVRGRSFWLRFELERATNVANGFAPLVALACLVLIVTFWYYTQLKRLGLRRRF